MNMRARRSLVYSAALLVGVVGGLYWWYSSSGCGGFLRSPCPNPDPPKLPLDYEEVELPKWLKDIESAQKNCKGVKIIGSYVKDHVYAYCIKPVPVQVNPGKNTQIIRYNLKNVKTEEELQNVYPIKHQNNLEYTSVNDEGKATYKPNSQSRNEPKNVLRLPYLVPNSYFQIGFGPSKADTENDYQNYVFDCQTKKAISDDLIDCAMDVFKNPETDLQSNDIPYSFAIFPSKMVPWAVHAACDNNSVNNDCGKTTDSDVHLTGLIRDATQSPGDYKIEVHGRDYTNRDLRFIGDTNIHTKFLPTGAIITPYMSRQFANPSSDAEIKETYYFKQLQRDSNGENKLTDTKTSEVSNANGVALFDSSGTYGRLFALVCSDKSVQYFGDKTRHFLGPILSKESYTGFKLDITIPQDDLCVCKEMTQEFLKENFSEDNSPKPAFSQDNVRADNLDCMQLFQIGK
eukprot:Nk52_evm118s485 gene=Nk52_evmTU118s485